MSTLQTKLGSDPTSPWVSCLTQDIDGGWHCALTKEDMEILWRKNSLHANILDSDFYDFLVIMNRMGY